MKQSLLILIVIFSFLVEKIGFGQAGQEVSLKNVAQHVHLYNHLFHKQKVFLQLDKESYFANDLIWFKAYVNSGYMDHVDTLSKNLYVELWGPTRERVQIIRVKLNRGLAQGCMSLSDTLEQGIYQIRAFTDIMLHLPAESFFSKNFAFNNTNHKYLLSVQEARKNKQRLKKINKERANFNIEINQLNQLIDGVPNEIYYKLENDFGEPVKAYGVLYESGKELMKVNDQQYISFGKFFFIPHNDKKYKLVFKNKKGRKQSIRLPETTTSGILGDVEVFGDSIRVVLKKPIVKSNDPSANRYFVLGHHNNMIYYTGVVDLRRDTIIVLPKEDFPRGILNFSVLSNRLVPEAQLSCFSQVENIDAIDLSYSLVNDTLRLLCHTSTSQIDILSASLSVGLSNNPIDDYIGYEQSFYFDPDIKGVATDLLLSNKEMLNNTIKVGPTVKPDWDQVFSDSIHLVAPIAENKIIIRGRILTEILDIPVKNALITLEVSDRYNDIFNTTSDEKGYFGFEGFDFYDTLNMKLLARKKNGRKGVLIELEDFTSPEILEYNGDFFLTTASARNNKKFRIKKGIEASEKARLEEQEAHEFYSKVMHGRPDFILYGKDVSGSFTILESITGRVPGVVVTDKRVLIRGPNSITGSNSPLVLIDGVPTDTWVLENIYMRDVDRVEFLKGASAAIYGLRGGNGVIAVYTLRGEHIVKGEINFSLTGYQKPQSFITSNKNNNLPQTLLWLPEFSLSNHELIEIPISEYGSKGKFLNVVFEGISEDGRPVSQTFSFKLNR